MMMMNKLQRLCFLLLAAFCGVQAAHHGGWTTHAVDRESPSSIHRRVVLDLPRGGGKKPTPVDLIKATVPKGQTTVGRVLEFHKISWLPVALYCLYQADVPTERGTLLAGLFGGYGILWVLKSYTFFDKFFYNDPSAQITGPVSFLFPNLTLGFYLLYPYVASRNTAPLSTVETVVACTLFTLGIFFHYAADAQKFYTLRYRGGLVTDGLFSRCRNPNKFGEWLIWIAWTIICGYDKKILLLPNLWMALVTIATSVAKDQSLSRYPEFAEWKKKTWLVVPKLF